ncbi:hypothetical protein N431DRAFT_503736 [Stipitochalara longipes BDJ]|nr:hypothetical protein N431DRAFT_503736 [Stipitochalara longipes BDJ]
MKAFSSALILSPPSSALVERSRFYRKTRDITIPITAQLSAIVLEQLSLLPSDQLQEIKAILLDWKVKEAARKPFDFSFHPDGRSLTGSEKILQQLADSLITAASEEHGLVAKASFKRGKVHGSRDAFELQLVEQAKADVVKEFMSEALAVDKVTGDRRDPPSGEDEEGWGSKFFKDFNEKEFEVGLCAVLLVEKVGMEKEFLGEKKGSLSHSVIKLKEIFKIKDLDK